VERRCFFEVWDTGTGIPADALELIWEDFYQLGNAERDRTKGLGLGLSIVRRTAALLGHAVSVSTRLGRGSVFRIAAPLAVTTAERPLRPKSSPRPHRKHSVLLVEDEPIQLMGLSDLLVGWGHTVETARNAEEALRAVVLDRPPTLIVSDLRLPGPMNGAAMITELRRRLGAEVAAVLVTGDTSPELLSLARRLDCAILQKPFDADRLREAIEEIAMPAQP
jgi:two-component system, sensor histidine kinase